MVFFRSYDRLSHKDARRGITGPSCRFMHKKDEVFFKHVKSFLCMNRHEGPFRTILVEFWVGFTWQFRGDVIVVVPCCVYRKRHISIYPPLR